jgi:hypothetical protein
MNRFVPHAAENPGESEIHADAKRPRCGSREDSRSARRGGESPWAFRLFSSASNAPEALREGCCSSPRQDATLDPSAESRRASIHPSMSAEGGLGIPTARANEPIGAEKKEAGGRGRRVGLRHGPAVRAMTAAKRERQVPRMADGR